jgi:hypothetical protein
MPRGGKRIGAGRPFVLTWEQKVYVIGLECEEHWRVAVAAKLKAAQEAMYNKTDYDAQISRVQSISIADRQAWHSTIEAETHADDIQFARREMADMDPETPDEELKLWFDPPSRPYGVRAKIIAEVATWASERFGTAISKRLVTTCWAKLRSERAWLLAQKTDTL